jgi:hypothetical protein
MKLKINAALVSVLCAAALTVSLAPVRAETITDIITFTASGFSPPGNRGDPVPVDPVPGPTSRTPRLVPYLQFAPPTARTPFQCVAWEGLKIAILFQLKTSRALQASTT